MSASPILLVASAPHERGLHVHKALFKRELDEFLHGEPEADERELALAAARATGVRDRDRRLRARDHGRPVVFEVNPYPSPMAWWAEGTQQQQQQQRIVDSLARLLERTAGARAAGVETAGTA